MADLEHEHGEIPEPADGERRGTDEQALAHIEHTARKQAMQALKPREREALYLKGLGYSYHEIAELSRGVSVNGGVMLRSDVGDMSLMEAARPPFVVPREAAGCPAACCCCLDAAALDPWSVSRIGPCVLTGLR